MPATEKAKRIHQMTITQWEAAFPDETPAPPTLSRIAGLGKSVAPVAAIST